MDRKLMEKTTMRNHTWRNYTRFKYILIPLLLCVSFLVNADNQKYSDVFIFGDSLSDTGNLGSVSNYFLPPYYQRRASNGPLAVETLAAKLGDTADASLHLLMLNEGHNYSVAGATASGNESLDLDTQIQAFQVNHGYIAPNDALYVVFIGGNDVRAALYEPDLIIAEQIIITAKKKIRSAIRNLRQMGARSFLIINSPNIARIPETRIMSVALNNPDLINRADRLSKRFNRKLHRLVERLKEQDNIQIQEFDLLTTFDSVIEQISTLGFINNTDACFSTITKSFHPDCEYGLNADKFIFFDELHPTARVHAIFGEAFYDALSQ